MIITVASYKGGVGKTTTAIHLARYLSDLDKTILFDSDPTQNAMNWSLRGKNGDVLTYMVAPAEHAAKLARNYNHVVVDMGQRPSSSDLKKAADGCDLLVIPAVPAPLDTDGLIQTVLALQDIGCKTYAVLICKVAPHDQKDAADLRTNLTKLGARVFTSEIPALKVFPKASGYGTTVDHVDDRNAARAWGAYSAVGQEIINGGK